jgi:hypothetical protein
MAWHLRALQLEDGRWSCRWGATEYGVHDELTDAVAHLRELARSLGRSALFVHPLRGPIQRLEPHNAVQS